MLYIENYCAYTISGTLSRDEKLVPNNMEADSFHVKEPNYTGLIPPMQLRRMSKPIKLGVAAVKSIIGEVDIANVNAINVGTAYGLLQDSEQFVAQMIAQQEQMLTPTAFIQSTHNTVGGAIALSLKCNAHNMTYVHKGHSVSLAVLDASLMDINPDEYVVLGGLDELTLTADAAIQHISGTKTAEGAAFLLLSGDAKETNIGIVAHEMHHIEESEVVQYIQNFLEQQELHGNDFIGLANIDIAEFENYNNLCGAYPTMFAFALALGANRLEHIDKHIAVVVTYYDRCLSMALLKR